MSFLAFEPCFVPSRLPVRVVCVPPSPGDFESYRGALSALPFPVELLAANGPDAVDGRVDGAIVDCSSADEESLRAVENFAKTRHAAVIAVSSRRGERAAVAAMKRGAADFLPKGADLALELPRALVEALATRQEPPRRRIATGDLVALAFTDPLTGLHNRRFFEGVLEREVAAARRYRHSLAVVLFDLDSFKSINDRFGHQAGDRVLVSCAARLREGLRTCDFAARWGGEELVALLPCTARGGAAAVVSRILDSFRRLEFAELDDLVVTASAGLVTCGGDRPVPSVPQLILAADHALYAAKRSGRDRLVVASDESPDSELEC